MPTPLRAPVLARSEGALMLKPSFAMLAMINRAMLG